MRMTRVKVRRARPSALTWALALAVTMLVVYLLTLGASPERQRQNQRSAEPGVQVTEEIAFAPLEVYCLQFASCASAEEARVEAARFVERGAAGYVHPANGKYLVLGAGYAYAADAERVTERLQEAEQLAGEVYALAAPQVRLRVTAGENQIASVVAADALMRTEVDQLGEMAFQIDRGELRPDAARTLIAVQASQARELLADLKAIPGGNSIFAGLTEQVERFAAALDVLAHESAASDLALSGKIKYNYLSARLGYIDFLRRLK